MSNIKRVNKTKARAAHKTPYWWRALERAKKRGGFTSHEQKMAESFTTCACGKQDSYLHTSYEDSEHAPWDDVLRNLGYDFYDYVTNFENLTANSHITEAENVLKAIEKRAAYLLSPKGRKECPSPVDA